MVSAHKMSNRTVTDDEPRLVKSGPWLDQLAAKLAGQAKDMTQQQKASSKRGGKFWTVPL